MIELRKFVSARKELYDSIVEQMSSLYPTFVAEKFKDAKLFIEFNSMLATINELFAERINTVKDVKLKYYVNLMEELRNTFDIGFKELDGTDADQIATILSEMEYFVKMKASLSSLFRLLEILDLRATRIRTIRYNLITKKSYLTQSYIMPDDVNYTTMHVDNFNLALRKVFLNDAIYERMAPSEVSVPIYVIDTESTPENGIYNDNIAGDILNRILQYILPINAQVLINIVYDYRSRKIEDFGSYTFTFGTGYDFGYLNAFTPNRYTYANDTTYYFTNVDKIVPTESTPYRTSTKASYGIIIQRNSTFITVT